MRIYILVASLAIVVTFIPTIFANAGCVSDCKSEYESEVDSCNIFNGDDPDNHDDLQSCIEDAKYEYDCCHEECIS